MKQDPTIQTILGHKEWLGYLQPVGLVVSPIALASVGAAIDRNAGGLYNSFLATLKEKCLFGRVEPEACVDDLRFFVRNVLGWEERDLAAPDGIEAHLPEYGETLRPDYVARDANGKPILLVGDYPPEADLDEAPPDNEQAWQASIQDRFDRLLRETKIPIGILTNRRVFRLVYAPKGESTGHVSFPVAWMAEPAGRASLAALRMLLSGDRLFILPEDERLAAILEASRKFQSVVSNKLSGQVLDALYELLKGLQAAHGASGGNLLRSALENDPNHVYAGSLAFMMRMVFLLYAEDRGLISPSPIYQNFYSIHGLYERLREDENQNPDTMERRYGAWAQLLTVFRLIYDGADLAGMHLPARHGHLFDPDRYPFLEGRPFGSKRSQDARLSPPLISDGVIVKILRNLLIVDQERITYRSLDVEQIGSIYETMMGFDLMVTKGQSVAIKPKSAKKLGAPVVINLEELLSLKASERAKTFQELTDRRLTGKVEQAFKNAKKPEELVAALDRLISEYTREILPKGTIILQPSEERRKTGSHYTPRSLTEPIVRETLRPLLQRIGGNPKPEQVLDLKICDPAMGSGAFLVSETCRQLADKLVSAWRAHGGAPKKSSGEEELLHARSLVAMQCLYGVDRNPLAVDLAKLSLWLFTLSKDHPFTFVDHALRHGDSLVGLTTDQIAAFHWTPTGQVEFVRPLIEDRLAECRHLRNEIRQATSEDDELDRKLTDADEALKELKSIGDQVMAAFFEGADDKAREALRREGAESVRLALVSDEAESLLELQRNRRSNALAFHWELEFPEVFDRQSPGFDAFVGNPPFMGGRIISGTYGRPYLDWLAVLHSESHGNADYVAHFFRRCFGLVRKQGCMGLIATKTIRQGDTRSTGLRWICNNGGIIYRAARRHKWEGAAAVVVSIVHICKGSPGVIPVLDGRETKEITAFLFHAGGHDDPVPLEASKGKAFQGAIVLGAGFIFDDSDKSSVPSRISEMHTVIKKSEKNKKYIFPYIGGEEVNSSPTHSPHRFIIDCGTMTEKVARSECPDLMRILEEKVKPERSKKSKEVASWPWWHFWRPRPELAFAIKGKSRVLACSSVQPHWAITFLPNTMVYSHALVVFAQDTYASFAVLQSRIHEIWARFFGSSLEDRLRYTPSDCFETFPLPPGFVEGEQLEGVGEQYFQYRAELMARHKEGMTDAYNRFDDPNEVSKDTAQLREFHAQMDRAVLDAYSWADLKPKAEFLVDYEIEDQEDESKKPWRFRWPDDIEDEVLARLVALNQERAKEERKRLGGMGDDVSRVRNKRSPETPHQGRLF